MNVSTPAYLTRVIGELFVERGIIAQEDLNVALAAQDAKPHLRIGEILISMGLVSITQLDEVVREHLAHQKVGTLLVNEGVITGAQLERVLAEQERTNLRMGDLLLGMGFTTEEQLKTALTRQDIYRRTLREREQVEQGATRRKAKIVATLGPASSSEERITALMDAGVNVFRLNFSHGEHPVHEQTILRVRELAKLKRKTIGILQDIQGPKIRIGDVEDGSAELKTGASFALVPNAIAATAKRASVSFENLLTDIPIGARVRIDDGRIELEVKEVTETELKCTVLVGGVIRPRKGVNFPGTRLGIGAVTAKDRADLEFGAKHDVDWVAVSFVQGAEDIFTVRSLLMDFGCKALVMAKIECEEAVVRLPEILSAADGVMVARGDLGVELPAEDVPLIQKRIIGEAKIVGKPVVTAPQMLDSMVASPRPTRAEASDVANAVLDGTDAVMLSNETATGDFPLEAVRTMAEIIVKAEQHWHIATTPRRPSTGMKELQDALTLSTANLANDIGARAIVVPSVLGATARQIVKYRPLALVLAPSNDPVACRQLAVSWGVYPYCFENLDQMPALESAVIKRAVDGGVLIPGDKVAVLGQQGAVTIKPRALRVETVPSAG